MGVNRGCGAVNLRILHEAFRGADGITGRPLGRRFSMKFAILSLAMMAVLMGSTLTAAGVTVPTVDDPPVYVVGVSGMT